MRRTTMLAVLVLVTGVLAAGCGSDGDGASGGAPVVEETTGSTETTAETTEEGTGTDTTELGETETVAGASDACKQLLDLSKEYGKAFGAIGGSSDTAGIIAAAAAFEEFAGKAPEEVRADFQVLAASFSKYAEILKDVDLTSGQQPDAATVAKIQALFTGEDATRSQEASQRINDWSNANCAP